MAAWTWSVLLGQSLRDSANGKLIITPGARGTDTPGRVRPSAIAVVQLAPTATTAAELVQARCRHLTAPTCF